MSWRDKATEERPGFGIGQLDGEEGVTVTFQDDGEMTETEYDEAFKAAVLVEEAPTGFTTMDGEAVEEGGEYYLFSSSTRFLAELAEHDDGDLTGLTVTIKGEGEDFERTYSVSAE